MLPAATTQGGMCTGPGDVCKTPAPSGLVPVTYVNISQLNLAVSTASNVMVQFCPAINLGSQVPISSGDEAGTGGGVVSGVFIGPTKFLKGSSGVLINGLPWVYLGAATGQNGASPNCSGTVTAVTQSSVLIPA